MRETHLIIADLNLLTSDSDRIKYLINNDGLVNAPPRIHYMAEQRPQDVPAILQTLTTQDARSHIMTFKYKTQSTPLDIISEKHIPAVLKYLSANERLEYIRQEDSGAKEFGDINNPKFKYINYIIFCDIYIEHLRASQYHHPTGSPKLTLKKIQAVQTARKILEDNPESEETMQQFYDQLVDNKDLLEKRRDTQFTSFLKSMGLIWLVDYAYSSFFVKTDGKVLIEKIEAIDKLPTHKP